MQPNRVMIFIDGSNIFIGCRRAKLDIRYEKFKNLLIKGRNIRRISYYSGVDEEDPTILEKQKRFFKMLKHLEISVITKPLRVRYSNCRKCGSNKRIKFEKGIDVSLATDLLWYAFQDIYDTAILISGDGDFIPAIERVRLLGKRVELWAFKDSIGRDLRNAVDKVSLINDIVEEIK